MTKTESGPAKSVSGDRRAQAGFTLLQLLTVIAIMGTLAAVAIPMTGNTLSNFRLSGDARKLQNAVSLAKMRAASDFSKARVYADLSTNSFRIEVWRKTGAPGWTTEGGTTTMYSADSFGFGVVGAPPPNTQVAIGESPQCLNNAGAAIGNTACVVFNSRGIPVDNADAPTGLNGLYVTDGTAVYAVTISATGLIRLWRTLPKAAPAWGLQ
jgi:Tfp pilus assembly protein FimT